ncbi:HEAT repeat domain-containing protein [Ammoniphilus resinae]|uniref:HEAT repeat protein n=1 Tax=Ammoniphilus resinae TaxID=861532 RepID=A0ABS4GR40_9BACL|nr:HEAT repeat domain-containing protein [Ammoniphilus resinae]MBP1932743.1 HEAT repeat protein [Ammoniphilus resinae]
MLGKMGGEKILGKIYDCYAWIEEDPIERDPHCEVRGEIISLIAAYRDIQAADWVHRALKTIQLKANNDMSIQLRANAALILSNFRVRGLLTDLSLLLFDFEPNIPVQTSHEYRYAKMLTRQAAAKGIGIYGDSSGAAILAVKLTYPNQEVPEVLVECMDALVALDEPRLQEWVTPYLEHGDPYLVASAATTLAAQLKEEALPILVAALDHPLPEAQTALVYAISSIRSLQTPIILKQLCTHASKTVRETANELA